MGVFQTTGVLLDNSDHILKVWEVNRQFIIEKKKNKHWQTDQIKIQTGTFMRGKNLVKSCLNYTSRRKVLLGLDHASCEVVNFFPTLGREAMRFLDSGRSLKTHPVGKTESRLSHHEEGKHRQHAEAGSLGITERPTAVISSLLTGHEQEVNQRHGLQRQHL